MPTAPPDNITTTPPPALPDLGAVKAIKAHLNQLDMRDAMQPRAGMNQETIRRYQNAMRSSPKSPFPPILAARFVGPGEDPTRLVVIDGFHRLHAAQRAGWSKIAVKVVSVDHATAAWMAADANLAHGLPIGRAGHVAIFKRFMAARQNVDATGRLKSYNEITTQLRGLRSRTTILRWMEQHYPAVAAAMAGREEADDASNATPQAGATDLEDKLMSHIHFAAKIVAEMDTAQRRAFEAHPKAATWTAGEVERRAAARSRASVTEAAARMIDASTTALRITPTELARAIEDHRVERDTMDF